MDQCRVFGVLGTGKSNPPIDYPFFQQVALM